MRINRKLNVVFTVEGGERDILVHAAPIAYEVFKRYFFTITKTYAAIMENGPDYTVRMGPRVARMMLERIAKADGAWDGVDGVENGLVTEIRRLTNVLLPMDNGWDLIPYHDAVEKTIISEEDADELENAIVFFTVVSAAPRPKDAQEMVEMAFGIWGAETTYSNATDYLNSLPISTLAEPTGKKVKASSIPV